MADTKLFEEFKPVSTEQWMEVVTKDLKGADFNKKLVSKTLDGLAIKPIYRAENLPGGVDTAPGIAPFLRGALDSGNAWIVREQIRETSIEEANAHILRSLNSGAEEISILTYPIGVPIKCQDDMRKLLEGVFIEMVPIHWMAGTFAPQILAMYVNEAQRRGIALEELSGSVDFDPIVNAACGWSTIEPENWKQVLMPLIRSITEKMPKMKVLGIRGSLIEKSGASVAQELALSLSLLAEYLVAFQDSGYHLGDVVPKIELRLAVGSNYFLEIAKIRAARVLVANILETFGVTGVLPHFHVDTTTSNKTLYDPYNNLLRGTTEAMSAVVAGVDSLSVATFDQGYTVPDEFSEHLARNTENLLREEAFLSKVVDPLGGSYYIESLTNDLASAAWNLFIDIENEGGFLVAFKSGTIAKWLENARTHRAKLTDSRRRTIVGTSTSPNLKERRLSDVKIAPREKVMEPWTKHATSLQELESVLNSGKSMADWLTETPIPASIFDAYRPSKSYETLRLAVEKHVSKGGKQPVILLALFGHPVKRKARAGFVTGFFGCGGYEIAEAGPFKEASEIGQAAKDAGADLVILCSSDEEYAAWIQDAKKAVGETKLIIAGQPENSEELTSLGADGFVHLKQNVVEELKKTHASLGISLEENA